MAFGNLYAGVLIAAVAALFRGLRDAGSPKRWRDLYRLSEPSVGESTPGCRTRVRWPMPRPPA